MANEKPQPVATPGIRSQNRPTVLGSVLNSPVLWGGGLTLAFYSAVPFLPVGRTTLQRYFCSHPLEYALVGLFFTGLAILLGRFVQLRRERAGLAQHLMPKRLTEGDIAESLVTVEQVIAKAPPSLRDTFLVNRLRETCNYLRGTNSANGLESHVKHLSDVAADRLHDSYSLLLTINWAVPIIGFLGTVVGITLAIANVTPEQLDTSLNSVTGGLAVAFDTTTVAMSFSLVLVFAYDWIKRSEQQILAKVDDIALREILPFFSEAAGDSDPLLQAQTEAARELMQRTEILVQEQTQFWRESVDGLRERWSETLNNQQLHLSTSLNAGVDATINDHSEQLRDVRLEFLTAFEQATSHFTTALETDRLSREERQTAGRQQFEQIWQQVSDDLQGVVRSHDAHTQSVIAGLTENIQQWQSKLEQGTQAVESQLSQLQQLAETLLRLADQEEQLVRVERNLSDNLEAVQAAETFEQTLHNLTAAVHLLTARAKPKAA